MNEPQQPQHPSQQQSQPVAQPQAQPKPQSAAPRVFDYKKQAKPQPKAKQTVTHVRKNASAEFEDEE